MKWYGITGGLGSGKSTVAQIIRESGFPVADADQMARQALAPGSPLLPLLRNRFGPQVFDAKDELNRKLLGELVFRSPENLRWLESVVHPEVQKQVKSLRSKWEKAGHLMAFYDVPLLFEKSLEKNFDGVIVVSSDPSLQQQRVLQRDGLSSQHFHERLQNQIPLSEKVKKAQFVIENKGSLLDLKTQVNSLLSSIT